MHYLANIRILSAEADESNESYEVTLYAESIPETAVIFVASYDEKGKMCEAKKVSQENITASFKSAEVKSIKAFAWKDTSVFVPLCESAERSVGSND